MTPGAATNVDLDKADGFVGRDAVRARKAAGPPARRLVQVLVEDPEPMMFHGEVVLADGTIVTSMHTMLKNNAGFDLKHWFIGSEGTLAFSTRIELKLWPLMGRRAVGVCHFGSFYNAMDAAQHIVRLQPIAVELIDRTMIELAREIAMFRPTLEKFVRGTPEAILLVDQILVMTARPGKIKTIINVGEKHPRSPDFMLKPRFSELRNECYALLRDEIRQAMASQRDPQGEAR